ncbi:molybdopterin molybdenumtransferase MoeA [Thioclava sp. SK-1]|nr:gephyrin-like molybdotransferase Glp [Thioclava sp. SK-1]OCX66576.1 molybdopterin molybdenumtransferase MoeA [Thioclava sp. SK-1]
MISVADARAHVLDLVRALPLETVPLRAALGRVMAQPVQAGLTQPPFDGSAMDGYWLKASDHKPGARLQILGEAAAGHAYDGPVHSGHAVRIFTGAPVPAPDGVVVLQENVTRDGDILILPQELSDNHNIRPAGGDFHAGHPFHPKRALTARDLGLLAAMNIAQVTVHQRPEVALIATGDELVMPGETPGPDQIISSNNFIVAAIAEAMGAVVRVLPIARDTHDSLRTVFALAKGADLIVTSGGASVGDHDLVGEVAAELGLQRSFWKIAMRPGKPLMAGRMGDAVLLGLPGNPVSATVCAELFLRPMLAVMQGLTPCEPQHDAVITHGLGPTGPRTHYMRAKLIPGTPPEITAFDNQDSAVLSVLAEADALLIREQGDGPIKAGSTVRYIPLR